MKPLKVNRNHDVLAWVNFPIIWHSLLIFVGRKFWHSIVISIKNKCFPGLKKKQHKQVEMLNFRKTEIYFKVACYKSYPASKQNKKEIKRRQLLPSLKALIPFPNFVTLEQTECTLIVLFLMKTNEFTILNWVGIVFKNDVLWRKHLAWTL